MAFLSISRLPARGEIHVDYMETRVHKVTPVNAIRFRLLSVYRFISPDIMAMSIGVLKYKPLKPLGFESKPMSV